MRFLARDAYRIVVVSIFILSACGRAPRSTAADAKDSHVSATSAAAPTVLLLGTSLTAGYGLDPADAWSAHLQQKVDSSGLTFHVVNAGVSGETSADALHRIDWLLSQGTPAVIVVETGANDALRGQSAGFDCSQRRCNPCPARLAAAAPGDRGGRNGGAAEPWPRVRRGIQPHLPGGGSGASRPITCRSSWRGLPESNR